MSQIFDTRVCCLLFFVFVLLFYLFFTLQDKVRKERKIELLAIKRYNFGIRELIKVRRNGIASLQISANLAKGKGPADLELEMHLQFTFFFFFSLLKNRE